MNNRILIGIALSSVALTAGAVGTPEKQELENVLVSWASPGQFKDIKSAHGDDDRYRQRVIAKLEKYLIKKVPVYLEKNHSIKLTIHNLDMAGYIKPVYGTVYDTRYITAAYPPMIDIEYTLLDRQGKIVKSERNKFKDHSFYLSSFRKNQIEFGTEKNMLNKWMQNTL